MFDFSPTSTSHLSLSAPGAPVQMNLHTMGTQLSPAMLNVFDSVAIMLLIPCVDRGRNDARDQLSFALLQCSAPILCSESSSPKVAHSPPSPLLPSPSPHPLRSLFTHLPLSSPPQSTRVLHASTSFPACLPRVLEMGSNRCPSLRRLSYPLSSIC